MDFLDQKSNACFLERLRTMLLVKIRTWRASRDCLNRADSHHAMTARQWPVRANSAHSPDELANGSNRRESRHSMFRGPSRNIRCQTIKKDDDVGRKDALGARSFRVSRGAGSSGTCARSVTTRPTTTIWPFPMHTKSAQLRPKFSRKAEAAQHQTEIGVPDRGTSDQVTYTMKASSRGRVLWTARYAGWPLYSPPTWSGIRVRLRPTKARPWRL